MDISKNIQERLYRIDQRFENRENLKKLTGIGFILLGILGGFIPIFQGWIFILLGCYLLFGEKFTNYLKKTAEKFKRER